MTKDEIDAIRGRYEGGSARIGCRPSCNCEKAPFACKHAEADIQALLAEVERLQAKLAERPALLMCEHGTDGTVYESVTAAKGLTLAETVDAIRERRDAFASSNCELRQVITRARQWFRIPGEPAHAYGPCSNLWCIGGRECKGRASGRLVSACSHEPLPDGAVDGTSATEGPACGTCMVLEMRRQVRATE